MAGRAIDLASCVCPVFLVWLKGRPYFPLESMDTDLYSHFSDPFLSPGPQAGGGLHIRGSAEIDHLGLISQLCIAFALV